MAKKPKKKKHEEHVDESWLVPYADILTLLLALFIVLFATSSVDQKKLEQLSAVFNQVFDGGTGVMDHSSPVTPTAPADDKSDPDMEVQSTAQVEDREALEDVQERLDDFIAEHELEEQFETSLSDEGLLITIRDSVLFDMGKATIRPEYMELADELSDLLVFDPPRNIIITGHTDNVPINTAQFGSNWELSAIRAVNFLKILLDSNSNLNSAYFSTKGYGENQPIADNSTDAGKAQNRRVEVLIQPRIGKDGELTVDDDIANIKEQTKTPDEPADAEPTGSTEFPQP